MQDFLLKKTLEAKKKVEANMEKVFMKNSKFSSSTVIVYRIEGGDPICRVIFSKDKKYD